MEYDVLVRIQTVNKFKSSVSSYSISITKPTALIWRLFGVISAYILHYHIKLAHYKNAIKLHLVSARVSY